jgi:uncharacterized membrane protein
MNIILAGILITNIVLLVGLYIAFRKIKQTKDGLLDYYREFVEPAAEGEPSPMALLVSSMGDVLARSIMAQAKAALMGMQSGEVRREKSLNADAAMSLLEAANPTVGTIVSGIPGIRTFVKKNPRIIDLAIQKFMNKGQSSLVPAENHSQTEFKL